MLRLSKSFAKAQAAYDAQLPPEYDKPECPECGGLLESDGDDWTCLDCEWTCSAHNEDDYDV
jgi:tRNA(Ile2) C34 agmatinyltransferase TiaS